ncbi:MAG: TlyA family RNA methyltransferase [Deltaproteobacteria bacterium]|nr:TlyA family RNA methyltransferase [Deltaproteobacteria bacterium]
MKKTFGQIEAELRAKAAKSKYVGRGGLKLEHALKEFQIDPTDKICLDVGASTGGFTDCLLQHNAKKVYAVDVGYGQLAWKLRQNKKIVVLERQNIRHISKKELPEPIALAVIDVSFISLKNIFPALAPFLSPAAKIVALIKPQFEVAKKEVEAGGLVTDPLLHKRVIEEIIDAGGKEHWAFKATTPSPILGADGNREFLILFEGH